MEKCRRKIIVFEGLDGTGKTSLAKAFAKKFGAEYVHNDKSYNYDEGKLNSYKYIEKLKESNDSLVVDRLVHTGEAIYAPVYRGYTGIDYFSDLEKKMKKEFEIIIVYVTAQEDIVKERLSSRGEDYIKQEDMRMLNILYENYLALSKFKVIRYDNSKEGIEENAMEVAKKITEEYLIPLKNGVCINN